MKKKIILLIGLTLFNGLLPSETTEETEKLSPEEVAKKEAIRRKKADKRKRKKQRQRKNKKEQNLMKKKINEIHDDLLKKIRPNFDEDKKAEIFLYGVHVDLLETLSDRKKTQEVMLSDLFTLIPLLSPDILKRNALDLKKYQIDKLLINIPLNEEIISLFFNIVYQYSIFQYLSINYTFDPKHNLFRLNETGNENFGYVFNSETGPDSGATYIPCNDIDDYLEGLTDRSSGAGK